MLILLEDLVSQDRSHETALDHDVSEGVVISERCFDLLQSDHVFGEGINQLLQSPFELVNVDFSQREFLFEVRDHARFGLVVHVGGRVTFHFQFCLIVFYLCVLNLWRVGNLSLLGLLNGVYFGLPISLNGLGTDHLESIYGVLLGLVQILSGT
jgi:hypothetical protein